MTINIAELSEETYLSADVVQEVVARDGLQGATKKVGKTQGMAILKAKNDVWVSFNAWYEGLDADAQNYMDLVLQSALVGFAEQVVEGDDVRAYDAAAQELMSSGNGDDLLDPVMWGPISTAITKEIIKRTIKKNCATKMAGC